MDCEEVTKLFDNFSFFSFPSKMGTTKVWNGGIVVQFLAGMPIRRGVAGNFYHRPICIYSVL